MVHCWKRDNIYFTYIIDAIRAEGGTAAWFELFYDYCEQWGWSC